MLLLISMTRMARAEPALEARGEVGGSVLVRTPLPGVGAGKPCLELPDALTVAGTRTGNGVDHKGGHDGRGLLATGRSTKSPLPLDVVELSDNIFVQSTRRRVNRAGRKA